MRWLTIVLAAILLSACSTSTSSSSGSGEPIPRRDANDLATVRALAGLENATPTPRAAQPTPTATTTPRAPLATATPELPAQNTGMVSDASYYDALLVPEDISSNWTFGDFNGIMTAAFCDNAAIEDAFTPLGWAYGSYSASGGQWAEQWVVRLTESDAQAAMEYARTSLTCDEFSAFSESSGVSYWRFAADDSPQYGDDTHAFSVTVTFENPVYTPLVGSFRFVRKGEYIVSIWHFGFSVDPVATARMTEIAVARLDLVTDNSV